MPRAKVQKGETQAKARTKSAALHRLSTSTNDSAKTIDSEITRVDPVESPEHVPTDECQTTTNGTVDNRPKLSKRLVYDILLTKIAQGNKCDWFELSEKLRGGVEIVKTAKKGKKGARVSEIFQDGTGLSGSDLRDIYHNVGV